MAAAAPMTATRMFARARRAAGVARARQEARTLCDRDRGVRRVRQLRPAAYYIEHLYQSERIGTPSPGRVSGFRLRQLRPGLLAHHLAARHRDGRAERARAGPKAYTRATPAESCRRRSASRASFCRASRTRRRARSSSTSCSCRSPPGRIAEAKQAAEILGDAGVFTKLPFSGSTKPMSEDLAELVLNRTWRPALADHRHGWLSRCRRTASATCCLPYTDDQAFLPPAADLRCGPGDEDYQAHARNWRRSALWAPHVEFDAEEGQGGWNAVPAPAAVAFGVAEARVKQAFRRAGRVHGRRRLDPVHEAMLGRRYPKTQFVVTGVLSPHSNAHGPNEFLHIPTGKKVSACIADVLADHAAQ